MKKLFSLALLVSSAHFLCAQHLTQTIKGRVVDAASEWPLPGAAVLLVGSTPAIGTATDPEGNFRLEGIPIGRVALEVQFVGYETALIEGVEVTSGKEVFLRISLREQVQRLPEVEIIAQSETFRPQNDMALVSARGFSIEESQRFAGARNDVSRMAQNFAGVRSGNDAVNDIVIRGNTPSGLLWRLEGIDIPNPNHYGQYGSTGGPVSMLNNNVLSNSDFFTAAFPAEYGDALSGVFDLGMRNGNVDKYEFLAQVGFNGLEVGAEGPMASKGSSFLINYRYSVLGLLQAMGVNFGTGSALPEYQDINLKLHLPAGKFGTFQLFGLGGMSKISFVASDAEAESDGSLYDDGERDVYSRGRMGVIGLTHILPYSNRTFHRITLAASGIWNGEYVDTLDQNRMPHSNYGQRNINARYTLAYKLQSKINSRLLVKTGFFANLLGYSFDDSVYVFDYNRFIPVTTGEGVTSLFQVYGQAQYRFTDRFTGQLGLHSQVLALNGDASMEPRASIKYVIAESHALTLGYGLHAKAAPLTVYFSEATDSLGNGFLPNRNIGFNYSNHIALGHEWMLGENLQLKTEVYWQGLFSLLVNQQPGSFSIVNTGSFNALTPDSLQNAGTGRNYGIEFTLQQGLRKGLYYLATASLYRSFYTASDGIERPTAFDSGYLINLVGGKEWLLRESSEGSRRHSLTTDFRFSWSGGQRTAPIDLERSAAERETVRDWSKAYSVQLPDYLRFDVRIAYRLQGKRATQEWAIDVQNATNRKNPFFDQYNLTTGEVDYVYQIGLLPIAQYRITF